MAETVICVIDVETTGLDPRIHQPYEVCWWREDEPAPFATVLPHTLEWADEQALAIGRYHDRGFEPDEEDERRWEAAERMRQALVGVTLVGSNPAFDTVMLTRVIGPPVWHHRLIDVADGAMWVFGWDRPKGLADVAAECRARGYDIPEPDHTAEGDVRATRAVYEALRAERAKQGRELAAVRSCAHCGQTKVYAEDPESLAVCDPCALAAVAEIAEEATHG